MHHCIMKIRNNYNHSLGVVDPFRWIPLTPTCHTCLGRMGIKSLAPSKISLASTYCQFLLLHPWLTTSFITQRG